jgi:hypothetical protein
MSVPGCDDGASARVEAESMDSSDDTGLNEDLEGVQVAARTHTNARTWPPGLPIPQSLTGVFACEVLERWIEGVMSRLQVPTYLFKPLHSMEIPHVGQRAWVGGSLRCAIV